MVSLERIRPRKQIDRARGLDITCRTFRTCACCHARCPFARLQNAFPSWGYLSMPRRSAVVPLPLRRRFVQLLRISDFRSLTLTEPFDIEGTQTEVRRLTKKRSARLRELALSKSGGVCEVCRRNFSRVLEGQGIRILQV